MQSQQIRKGVLFWGRCSPECHRVNFCSTAGCRFMCATQFIGQQIRILERFLSPFHVHGFFHESRVVVVVRIAIKGTSCSLKQYLYIEKLTKENLLISFIGMQEQVETTNDGLETKRTWAFIFQKFDFQFCDLSAEFSLSQQWVHVPYRQFAQQHYYGRIITLQPQPFEAA